MKFLTSGKVKDIYEYDEGHMVFRFSDRVSAYDVKFQEHIPRKGEVLCKFAEFWFDQLDVSNHFVRRISDTEILVKKLRMLPIECVVRGYFYGSLSSRWRNGTVRLPAGTVTETAARLPEPMFDPTTKSEHDMPIDRKAALEMNLVTAEQFDWLSDKSIQIYTRMADIANAAGFILADLKLEFGLDGDRIVLADSIGPDEYRLWSKESYKVGVRQEAYDKQILRDWLSEHGHAKRFDDARAAGLEPSPPAIPDMIVSKMTSRYVTAYQRLTGRTL